LEPLLLSGTEYHVFDHDRPPFSHANRALVTLSVVILPNAPLM